MRIFFVFILALFVGVSCTYKDRIYLNSGSDIILIRSDSLFLFKRNNFVNEFAKFKKEITTANLSSYHFDCIDNNGEFYYTTIEFKHADNKIWIYSADSCFNSRSFGINNMFNKIENKIEFDSITFSCSRDTLMFQKSYLKSYIDSKISTIKSFPKLESQLKILLSAQYVPPIANKMHTMEYLIKIYSKGKLIKKLRIKSLIPIYIKDIINIFEVDIPRSFFEFVEE